METELELLKEVLDKAKVTYPINTPIPQQIDYAYAYLNQPQPKPQIPTPEVKK